MSGAHAPAPLPERDRRIRTAVALGTLLVVLVTAVWFSVRSLTSVGQDATTVTQTADSPAPTSPPEPAATESEQDEAAAPEAAATSSAEQIAFEAPSGNIACVLDATTARCDIAEREWDQGEPPADCDGTWGASLAVDEEGAREVCTSDSALGAGQVLDYGSTATQGDLRCRSEESGVTCENTETGDGFTVSRAAYETF